MDERSARVTRDKFQRIQSWCEDRYLIDNTKIKPRIQLFARCEHDTKKKINFDYLQSTAELIRRHCLPKQKLHVLKFFREEESSFECSILNNIFYYYCETCPWQSLKFCLSIFLHFSREKFIIIFLASLKF